MTTKELVPPGAHQRGQGTFQQQLEIRTDGITEASPECVLCGHDNPREIYQLPSSAFYLCNIDLCLAVSLAADVFPGDVRYSENMERMLLL